MTAELWGSWGMDFVKVWTTFHDHRKTAQLDCFAVGIWTLCLSWCGRQETDGIVPQLVVRRMGGDQGLEAATRLVNARLWEEHDDGWRFHEWPRYQETTETLEQQRERWRERQRRHRAHVTRDSRDKSRDGHGRVTRKEVEVEVEVEGEVKSPTGLSSSVQTPGPIDVVFEEWRRVTGRDGRTQLTPRRRKAIAAALKSHGVEDTLDAVRGCQDDPWPERPLHNDVTVLLRTPEQIEKFRDLHRHGAPRSKRRENPIDAQINAMLGGMA